MELKLLVDKTNQKVVFAEATKEFVDFLFSLMYLPLGTTFTLLRNKNIAGCLGSVHDSINSMPESCFPRIEYKEALLNPKFHMLSDAPLRILPNSREVISQNQLKVYICGGWNVGVPHTYVSDDPNSVCPNCNRRMVEAKWCHSNDNGIVNGVGKYMVMDNLEVQPMSTVSCFALMKSFGIQDFTSLEERTVRIELAEALKLLQLSFQTKNVLSRIFTWSKK